VAWPNIDPSIPSGNEKKKFGDDRIREAKQNTVDALAAVSNYSAAGTLPALRTAVWTTATRPTGANLVDRVSGYNTDLGYEEYYDLATTTWKQRSAGPNHTHSDGVPVGAVFAFPAATVPANYLECNGDAISRTTYADLFALIGTTYGTGDGSTTFNIPDYRGVFLRGNDNSKGYDEGRTLGSFQDQDIQAHNHEFSVQYDPADDAGDTPDTDLSAARGFILPLFTYQQPRVTKPGRKTCPSFGV
jgi:microcystin-dependent protein